MLAKHFPSVITDFVIGYLLFIDLISVMYRGIFSLSIRDVFITAIYFPVWFKQHVFTDN